MIVCQFEHGKKASLRHAVVDCLVLRGEEILLVKRAQGLLEAGKWALVGGFIERDERIEEAVRREVLEETGYEIQDLQFLSVIDNPDRPGEDRQNISFVYTCLAREKVGEADAESDEQRWFPLDALPQAAQMAFDHLDCITAYLARK